MWDMLYLLKRLNKQLTSIRSISQVIFRSTHTTASRPLQGRLSLNSEIRDLLKTRSESWHLQVKHESQGLKQQYEQNCNIQCKQGYCDTTSPYPCSKTQEPYYFGRGPIQLFWNYNYGACGDYIGKRLLQVPGQISTNPVIAFQTAFWFWMTQGSHRFILAKSFSGTTRAINGGYSEEGRRQMLSRVAYYKSFCTILGVDPGTDLEC
ncbi:endochitinase At2g43610-like [Physcomitrium patens]|uniref:endochitinase At2g43610-like n=1 Tax=Physcomitrium patens TaxID=3218 RepID=UPI003CCDFACF